MGYKRNKIQPINDECPICYEINSNNFILPCGHRFDYICLQKTFFDYFIVGKPCFCPLCRSDVKKKTLKLIFKKIYVPHIYPTEFVNKNTINLKNKVLISKIQNVKINENLTYLIPCYKLNNISVQHFFHLDNIEFIYDSFTNDLENVYKMKIICLFNKKKNDWNKFIKNNHLNKILKNSSNEHDDPTTSISLYIRNPNNIITYNEKYGTIEHCFHNYDQKATLLFRMFMVKWMNKFFFVNELYGICYKN